MSARLAWHRPTFRVLTILLLLFVGLVSAFFLVRVVWPFFDGGPKDARTRRVGAEQN